MRVILFTENGERQIIEDAAAECGAPVEHRIEFARQNVIEIAGIVDFEPELPLGHYMFDDNGVISLKEKKKSKKG